MRFATDTCLFKSPENVDLELQLNSTCAASSTCGPLKDALGTGKSNEEEKESNRYAFCSASQDGFGKDILPCLTCLEDESESTYLSNCALPSFSSLAVAHTDQP
jgi:hypothetical protein